MIPPEIDLFTDLIGVVHLLHSILLLEVFQWINPARVSVRVCVCVCEGREFVGVAYWPIQVA